MSQATTLKDLKEKRRRKYWKFKDADQNDWRKRLFGHELISMNNSIEYLQQISIDNLQVVVPA